MNLFRQQRKWWKIVDVIYFPDIDRGEFPRRKEAILEIGKNEGFSESLPSFKNLHCLLDTRKENYYTAKFKWVETKGIKGFEDGENDGLAEIIKKLSLEKLSNEDKESSESLRLKEYTKVYDFDTEYMKGLANKSKESITPLIEALEKSLNDSNPSNFHDNSHFKMDSLRKEELENWNGFLNSLIINYLSKGVSLRSSSKLLPLERKLRDGFFESDCMVCFNSATTFGNPVIYCSKCDSSFHKICYGIAEIPEGNFLCHSCHHKDRLKSCEICKLEELPMKKLKGTWLHISCGFLKGVISVIKGKLKLNEKIPIRTKNDAFCCQICEKNLGAMYSCRECHSQLHFLCAFLAGCFLQISISPDKIFSVIIKCRLHSEVYSFF